MARLGIGHKPLPHIATAKVFRTEQNHADVESHRIGGNPAGERIESIGEAILAPYLVAELVFHGVHCWDTDVRRDHERSAGGTRHDGAIDLRVLGRTSPGFIAFWTR